MSSPADRGRIAVAFGRAVTEEQRAAVRRSFEQAGVEVAHVEGLAPIIPLLVQGAHIPSVLAAAITLAAAFVVRFVYHALWVYAPKRKATARIAAPAVARAGERTLES